MGTSTGSVTAGSSETTGLLERWSQGDHDALGQLMPRVYDHLHRLANRAMRVSGAITRSRPRRWSTRFEAICFTTTLTKLAVALRVGLMTSAAGRCQLRGFLGLGAIPSTRTLPAMPRLGR